ncbi:hypothetical protein AGMMS50268_36020 [Spirochaetia bacterium]|nr:hypothetical protein AGMMS50268_36020 [Spirochaetia bacterium]
MENLLRDAFTRFYGLPHSDTPDIAIQTNDPYFGVGEDYHHETQICPAIDSGIARYSNTQSLQIIIINYDKFLSNLPHRFQQNKKRCDLIVYSQGGQDFLLNELKDKNPEFDGVREYAITQLVCSLALLMEVPEISEFAHGYPIGRCCYFNKKEEVIVSIIAVDAFNQLNTLNKKGFKLSNPEIESLRFELFEYSGSVEYIFS